MPTTDDFDPRAYLAKPYVWRVVPEEDGTFAADIQEFPGCIAVGGTASEALVLLEEVAVDWLESMHESGRVIPEPAEVPSYSGRVAFRLAKSLHRKAALAAEADGVSLNQFLVNCVAQRLGERDGLAKSREGSGTVRLFAGGYYSEGRDNSR